MWKKLVVIFVLLLMGSGCSSEHENTIEKDIENYPASPAHTIDDIIYPQSDAQAVLDSSIAMVDYSHADDGYVCARRNVQNDVRIKIQIAKDDQTYNYDLLDTDVTSFPLQMGSGSYRIKILKNIQNDEYAIVQSKSIQAKIKGETTPFYYPNQLVWYQAGDPVTKLAIETVKEDTNDLQRIRDIYTKVIETIRYDDEKAVEAATKYLIPDLTNLLEVKRGICFDYASLMTAMLRINHIPARLICGNTDVEYHAWVEVYVEGRGWVNPDIFMDEDTWTRMDPTFASQKFQYDGNYEAIYYY